MQWGGKFVKSWSKTMDVLALSTGESELAAVVKGATEGLGIQALLGDFGHLVNIQILSDATAAIGIVKRLGLGRVRHLAVGDPWVQQRLRRGDLTISKWPGEQNPADLMTRHKSRPAIDAFMEYMGYCAIPGRASVSPEKCSGWPTHQVEIDKKANFRKMIFGFEATVLIYRPHLRGSRQETSFGRRGVLNSRPR